MNDAPYRAAELRPDLPPDLVPPARNLRLAGGFLLTAAVLGGLVAATGADADGGAGDLTRASPIALVIDAVLGVSLMRVAADASRRERTRGFVIFRTVVGALVFGIAAIASKRPADAAFVVLFTASMLYLLKGRGGRWPTRAAVATQVLVCGLAALGLVAQTTGRAPLAGAAAQLSDDFVQPRPARVRGVRGHYELPLPDGWQVRTEASRRRDNAEADQWISLPDRDAHLLVIAETIQADQTVDVQKVLDGMLTHMRSRMPDVREVSRGELPGAEGQPYLEYDVRGPTLAFPMRYIATVRMNGPEALQFSAYYPTVAADMRAPVMAMLRSVTYPEPEALPFAADGGDAPMAFAPAGPLAGASFGYELTLPRRMYLRSEAATRAQNAVIDRWLVLSFENVQLFTIAERDDSPDVPLASLTDAMLAPQRQQLPDLVVDSAEAFPGRADGMLLRYHATADGAAQRFAHAIFRAGGMLVQLNGNCAERVCARYDAEMLDVMRSLRITRPLAPEARPAARRRR